MSIKVTGTPPIRPSTDQSNRVKKSGANFEDSLKTEPDIDVCHIELIHLVESG